MLSRSLYCTLGPTFFNSLLLAFLAAEPECLSRLAASCSFRLLPCLTARASWLPMFSTLKGRKPVHSMLYCCSPRFSGVAALTSPLTGKAVASAPVIGKPVRLSLLPPSPKLDWYMATPL